MRMNIRSMDRWIRALVVPPTLLAVAMLAGPLSAVAVLLYVVAALSVASSALRYCPIYHFWGDRHVRSCSLCNRSAPGNLGI